MSDADTTPPPDDLRIVDLKQALEERYLSYALSTITQRALPDARDGLKPVHRRILHAMRLLKLDPSQGYKKSARVVGDVIGKFHPHGDSSIYDALVRLAQDFSLRYPLVDGQGNFGNIDGDSAAAMRYTESRMTEVATRLLEGITENAIDFKPTYDGEDDEPIVLPSNFPNLLANGSMGIAVGMATSVPPHNIVELCNASLKLIQNPNATVEELIQQDLSAPPSMDDLVRGPDYPTGGQLVESRSAIVHAYETGRGSFRTRATWDKEDKGRGVYQIVVTQIPYGVQKSRLVEKIAELLLAKKLPLLKDVRDESADDIRLILEPKNGQVDAVILMEQLFKLTELEVRFGLNLNVLDRGTMPRVMSLADALRAWLEHRKEVLVRRSQFRVDQITARLEVLDGYIIAYLNLDEVIRIIREDDDPKASLIATFKLTDNQAEAILNMRLRSLRKLEEMELRTEHSNLSEERTKLEALLGSEKRQWGEIAKQVEALKKSYPLFTKDGVPHPLGARRTILGVAPKADLAEITEAFIEREPITVVLSEKGWIRAPKGHNATVDDKAFKSGDRLRLSFNCETTDKLLMLTTDGRVYTIVADKLPGGRGQGEPVRLLVDMEEGADIVALFVHKPGQKRIIASSAGYGFIVSEDDIIANTRKGKQVLNVSAPEEAKLIVPSDGDRVAIIGQNRKLLVFPMTQLAQMTRGKGVRLQRYKDGGVSDIKTFFAADGLTWQDSSGRTYSKPTEELVDWAGDRAAAGRQPPTGFPKNNKFVG
ncbi:MULTISPECIES: DNA topoisomerase IV subunit A [unclassified Devosia]|uniref:DNA topoisomerase IV subunit A n=1 Tax=unclassified Devosia TaxID=196773 RepID=UPI00145CD059|nr:MULTISPECIES: DNA topoisomerase IV subunit A [unclassified Devosia]MBJ6986816.1 DNA topoisomerase IV subunit A [Devosia sp. MC521]QMW63851.1 DNA topoisomerase IV subunit A [Devosia sp. MC521]